MGMGMGIRGLPKIIRGQIEVTEENAEYITRCAQIAFKGNCTGSLRDSITLIVHSFGIMFDADAPYCIDEEDVELLIKQTESKNIFEALAKVARKELNGKGSKG